MSRRVTLNWGSRVTCGTLPLLFPMMSLRPGNGVRGFDRWQIYAAGDGALKATRGRTLHLRSRLTGDASWRDIAQSFPACASPICRLSAAKQMTGVREVLALDDREIRFAGQEVAAGRGA